MNRGSRPTISTHGLVNPLDTVRRALGLPPGATENEIAAAAVADSARRVGAADSGAKTEAGRPIDKVLPQPARQAAGLKREHGKVWQADLNRRAADVPAIDLASWKRRAIAAIGTRTLGEPSAASLEVAINRIVFETAKTGGRYMQRTLQWLGRVTAIGRETWRRSVDWLEQRQLLPRANVLTRVAAGVYRAANLYRPEIPPSDAAAAAAVDPSPQAAQSDNGAFMARLAGWLGLHSRPRGINATPLRAIPDPPPYPAPT